jgi:hypothetical protein
VSFLFPGSLAFEVLITSLPHRKSQNDPPGSLLPSNIRVKIQRGNGRGAVKQKAGTGASTPHFEP